MSAAPAQRPGPLPAALRAKVVSLACQGLGQMPVEQIPPALRKAAGFAPARRAKLVGNQVLETLEADDEFREHLATQVRVLAPAVARALDAGTTPDPDAMVEAAAVAAIERPDGWVELVEKAAALETSQPPVVADQAAAIERLKSQLSEARAETKAVRDKLRARVDDLKSENTTLRRTLGTTRRQLDEARDAAQKAGEWVDTVRRDAEVAAREVDAEVRRLKGRIAELEQETASAKRSAREGRDVETMRLRLLLETILDSASGLRRELALPPAETLPADTVDAVAPATGDTAGVGRALHPDDPALLRRLLELPRLHLIVDGYNVSKTAWPTAPLDQQRSRLVSGVSSLVAGKGIETTIVFDGADLPNAPAVPAPRGVRVRFSPPGVIADDLIRQLVEAEPQGRPVVVVSTDREVAETTAAKGARAVAAAALVAAMGL